MLRFIQNIGEYFSSNYFDEDFTAKVLGKTGYAAEDIREFNKRISPLKDKFFRFKQLFLEGKLRNKDKIYESHKFHTLLLNALGYDGDHPQYQQLFHLTDKEVIPVRHTLYRGDQAHLMIMEMQALIKVDDEEPDGLFEQRYNVEDESQTNPPQKYHRSQWEEVFQVPPNLRISPVVINKAVSELFLFEPHLRPRYILLLAGNVVYLLEQEKWFRGSYLVFDLEELFSEATANRNANTFSSGSNYDVVSDYSNVPYQNVKYFKLNAVGKQWVKKYFLALCIENLPDEHYARAYIKNRKIPEKFWGEILFVAKFRDFLDKEFPNHGKETERTIRLW